MKFSLKKLPVPALDKWDQPYFMLYREDENKLISLHGTFPVFETKEDAEMVIEAMRESEPETKLIPYQVVFGVAAAAEIKYGKPVELVKPIRQE